EISGNGNGRINPGEDLKLYVMLKNYGQHAATNVNATLTTTNSHITITDNSANYGTIDPYDSTYGSEWFEFTVDYAAVDQEVIPFEINITSNEDSWTSSFNYNVYAPMLSYLRVQVNDSEGNGNGLIDPGETVTLRVYARNSGHEDAPGVVGKLTCTDTRVVFNNNNLSMGDIAVGGNGYADFSVTFGSDIEIGEIIPIGLRLTSSNLVFLSEFVVFMGAQYYTTSFEGDDYLVWTYENPWARRSDQHYHGSYSLGTGVYSNNMNASLYTPSFIVMSQCTLSFYEWSNFENNFDFGYVEYRLNGGSWVQLSQRSGDNRTWQRAQYVISGNPGDTLAIRFRATSDVYFTRDGWYIDSLKVGPVIFIPSLQYVRYEVEEVEGNGNGVPDPGETVNLYLVLGNSLTPVRNVEGHLVAMDENSEVLDSVSIYGDIESFGSSTGDGFRVSIVPSVDIEGLSYRLYVVGSGYSDTIDISLPVGRYVGPCNYGYRAFTDLSFYEGLSPEYSWIEIKNIGTQIASTGDDVYASVTLPFTFKFFGTNQTSLTVSSNGWVGFGSYSSASYSNTGIPNSSSPNNIVAITWDDLNPNAAGSGKIWYYHDTESHIFIVEYDSVYHYGTSVPLKAEVILYNPAYYPTVTGDGDIVIQYKVTPGQDDYTCGIENASGNDGIGYYYDGTYAAGADPIVAGRAIKFTTDTTGLVFGVEEHNPRAVKLLGVSSNPLRGQGYVAFELPARAVIKVELINVQGRVVKTLASGVYDRGYHRVKVDGTSLPQGIYFVRLNTETRDEISKFLIVK
ncbi:MAG: T9SS type A sorting domain-containing protein, partial [Candidatus Hydrothermia bacterium]